MVSAELAGRTVFIGHELTAQTKRMLLDSTMTLTIDQNPELQARRAVGILLRRFGYIEGGQGFNEVPFVIYGPENLNLSAV